MLSYFFNSITFNKVGFDDVYFSITQLSDNEIIIINTLINSEQNYLIKNTISFNVEEKIINDSLQSYKQKVIIIYGKNCLDNTVEIKYNQLIQLGYLRCNLFIYYGGIFEWALLQDTYGEINFPTTSRAVNYLQYKPESNFKNRFVK